MYKDDFRCFSNITFFKVIFFLVIIRGGHGESAKVKKIKWDVRINPDISHVH